MIEDVWHQPEHSKTTFYLTSAFRALLFRRLEAFSAFNTTIAVLLKGEIPGKSGPISNCFQYIASSKLECYSQLVPKAEVSKSHPF